MHLARRCQSQSPRAGNHRLAFALSHGEKLVEAFQIAVGLKLPQHAKNFWRSTGLQKPRFVALSITRQRIPAFDKNSAAARPVGPAFWPTSGCGHAVYQPNVREKEIHAVRQNRKLLDHLVGASEQRRWDVNADRLSGLKIGDEFVLGRLRPGQVWHI
jgi:hypothetical protein